MSKLTLTTEGDTHVVVKRRFAAAPEAVYRAHTESALVQQWMLGPDGWTMPVCIGEARAGYDRHWTPVHLDLHVQDFDAVLAKVRAQSGNVEMEFKNQGPMPVGFCSDPFGNGFCVIGEGAKMT